MSLYKYIQYPCSPTPMLLVLRAQFSFQNQCISMFPSNCFQSWFCIVCWRAVRLTVTAVPFLFYSGHIKAQTPAHTNLAAAVQQACLCYYQWWMCVISSIPLNRCVADPCVGPDWPQDLWASSGYGLLMKLHVCQGVCVSTHLIISPQIWVTRRTCWRSNQ